MVRTAIFQSLEQGMLRHGSPCKTLGLVIQYPGAVKPATARWFGIKNHFLTGRLAKLLLLAVVIGFIALDTTGGDFELSRARAWFELVLPWTPLLVMLIGPRVAAASWFVMFAVVLAMGAAPLQVSGTALPTILLVGICAYVLVWRAAAIFTAGVIVMIAIAVAMNPIELGLAGAITFATLMVLAAAVGFGLSLLTARLERSAKRVAELREQQSRVRAEERTRLAYELHDIVASQVTLIAMQARRAEFAGPEQTGQILERIGDAAGQTLQDLRSLVLLLKSEDEEAGPSAIVSTEVAASPSAGAPNAGAEPASAGLRQTLGRTLRELGTNILKHGDPAGPVALRIAFAGDSVTISASNRISGVAPIFSTGTGLEAMRARSEVFGATLTASAAGDRWTTSVSFPTIRALPVDDSESAT